MKDLGLSFPAVAIPEYQEACEVCLKANPLTNHHVVPASVERFFTRPQRLARICGYCHNRIHRMFDHNALALNPWLHIRDQVRAEIAREESIIAICPNSR